MFNPFEDFCNLETNIRQCVSGCCVNPQQVHARGYNPNGVLPEKQSVRSQTLSEEFPVFEGHHALDARSLRECREGWKGKKPMVVTSAGGDVHTITHVNHAFIRFIGKKKKEIVGRSSIRMCFGVATLRAESERLLRHMRTGTVGHGIKMILHPYPQTGEKPAATHWVELSCLPLADWKGAHKYNKVVFEVGEIPTGSTLWHWTKKNEFTHINQAAFFESAVEHATSSSDGILNRTQRHLQAHKVLLDQNEQWVHQDPSSGSNGRTSIVIRRPTGTIEMKQKRPEPRVKSRLYLGQELDPESLPDGVLRGIVRSPYRSDEDLSQLSNSFQQNKSRVEQERLEQQLFSRPDPKLLSDMRKIKDTINLVDGNFITAGVKLRALQDEAPGGSPRAPGAKSP